MSNHGSARVVLAGAAIAAVAILAGCGGVPKGTKPDVPGANAGGTAAAAANSRLSGTAPLATPNSLQSATGAQPFAKANSIPFPVAVGNTWVYQTQADGQSGRTTNRIVGAGPGSAGYRVTVSSTADVGGSASTVVPVYTFYPDGTIGYPVPPVSGAPVRPGSDVRWPDAAGLASGKIYRSVLQTQAGKANVTIQGFGTTSVKVPAGTYQASVVQTIIYAQGQTVEVTVWIAQGTGPVKTQVLIRAPGGTGLTTNELLSFTKAVSAIGDGS
jgi:hypothetical protein